MCLASAAIPAVASANLLQNGDFESSNVPESPGYLILDAGDSTTGWQIVGSENRTIWIGHHDTQGDNVVDISGQTDLSGSGISQEFATTPGDKYLLSFDVQRFRPNSPDDSVSYFDVSVGDLALDELAIRKSSDIGIHEYYFTATQPITELRITSGSTPWHDDAYLDDISVTPVTLTPKGKIAIYVGITISGQVGQAYSIEFSPKLDPSTWTQIATIELEEEEEIYFDKDSPGRPSGFYRISMVSDPK